MNSHGDTETERLFGEEPPCLSVSVADLLSARCPLGDLLDAASRRQDTARVSTSGRHVGRALQHRDPGDAELRADTAENIERSSELLGRVRG